MKNARRWLIGIIILFIFTVLASFNTVINFITDYKWFRQLGFEKVFLTKLVTQLKIGIPAFVILTVLIYLYLLSIKKNYYKKVNVVYKGISEKRINQIALAGAVLASFIASVSLAGNLWFDILKYFNSTSFNLSDPIFNNDISFYMFKYPLLTRIYLMLISFLVLLAVITVLFYLVMTTLRRPTLVEANVDDEFDTRRYVSLDNGKRLLDIAVKQLMAIGIIFFIILGIGYFLRAYDLLYSARGVVYGAAYTDISVTLLKYRIITVLSFVSAVLLAIGIKRRSIKLILTGPALMILISIIGNIMAALVQSYIVSPDEISKEKKYIEYNIKFTQKAFGLENVEEREFPATQDLSLEDLRENEETLINVRINDYRPSKLVYNQKQGIRYYYNFNDVDVDRYYVDGKYRQMFISARELDQTRIREEVLTFINRHLKYTHGYGVVMSPVNTVTPEGLPKLLIQNIPPTTDVPEFKVERPEIYFGELTDEYIIVNTKEKEFDYPRGESNVESVYEGNGGIRLNGINKLLYAYKQRSLKMLLSGNITSESRIIINRNVHDRVRKIMPYILYDSDPYIVLHDGKLYWIIDGYTTSGNYPYSEPFGDSGINYIRNSVKVVIDAYNGDTTYYVADETDPIINTYRKIFPQLFTSINDMPDGLRNHIRYPQVLFNIQSDIYRKYHMEDPRVFYNQEDQWDIAHEMYEATEQQVESNYLIMKLPEEEKEEFVLMLPYTPKDKKNMTSIMVARNDRENYGKLAVYRFPKSKNIYGPMQVENKIDSDDNISREFTLWSQKGSAVIRGNLLTIPIDNSILYVEPVYLRADTENSIPEVKRVIVAYGDKIVMEPTFEEALERIFGEDYQRPVPDEMEPDVPYTDEETVQELIIRANDVFDRAQEAQRQGDWAEYGRLIDELETVLKRLNELNGQPNIEE